MYRFGYGNMMGWGGPSILSIILSVLFWLFVVMVFFWIIKMIFMHKRGKMDEEEDEEMEKGDNKYIQILKERYAKGEITKREFDERKKDLS